MKQNHLLTLGVSILPFFTSSALGMHLVNPNLLVDPGFEGTITNDGPPFVGFWEGFSLDGEQSTGMDTAQFTTNMPRSGSQSFEIRIDDVTNSFAGAFQDIFFGSGQAGNQAYFSGWHKSLLDAGGMEIRVEWRDSVADTEISRTPNLTPAVGTEYEEFMLSDVVPAGADSGRVVYAIQSFGAGPKQHVFVDDLNFNIAGFDPSKPVPEGGSTGLAFAFVMALGFAFRSRLGTR